MSLHERIRQNIEAAPWVVEAVFELEQQLAAEREARGKAETNLTRVRREAADYSADKAIKAKEVMEQNYLLWMTKAKEFEQRAESAERRIREAQGQEPMFWVRLRSDGGYEAPIHNNSIEKVRKESGAWSPLYAAPIPPADVTALIRENAELTRKLAMLEQETTILCNYSPRSRRTHQAPRRSQAAGCAGMVCGGSG